MKPALLSLLVVATALSAPRHAPATTVKKMSLRDLTKTAELIAEAEVIAIQHRNSDVVEPGDADLPHTFVTFAIHHTLKGESSAGDKITLRLLGGPNGRGTITVVAGMPEFRVGDRDILFVRQNGSAMCPVFGWEHGRLRVVRNQVYDNFGREVWVTPQGSIAPGEMRIDVRAEGYPQLASTPLHADEATHTFVPAPGALLPNPAGMRQIIELLLADVRRSGPLDEHVTVMSQDPGALLRVPRLRSVPPPIDPIARKTRRPEQPIDSEK